MQSVVLTFKLVLRRSRLLVLPTIPGKIEMVQVLAQSLQQRNREKPRFEISNGAINKETYNESSQFGTWLRLVPEENNGPWPIPLLNYLGLAANGLD